MVFDSPPHFRLTRVSVVGTGVVVIAVVVVSVGVVVVISVGVVNVVVVVGVGIYQFRLLRCVERIPSQPDFHLFCSTGGGWKEAGGTG